MWGKKRCRDRQTTDDDIIRRMRVACRILKTTSTMRICDTYCFSTEIMVTANGPQFYVIRTLPFVLYTLSTQDMRCVITRIRTKMS